MNEVSDRQEGGTIPPASQFTMCVQLDDEFALTAPSQVVQKALVFEFNQARVALARLIVEKREAAE